MQCSDKLPVVYSLHVKSVYDWYPALQTHTPVLVAELHLEWATVQGLVGSLQGLPARPSDGAAMENKKNNYAVHWKPKWHSINFSWIVGHLCDIQSKLMFRTLMRTGEVRPVYRHVTLQNSCWTMVHTFQHFGKFGTVSTTVISTKHNIYYKNFARDVMCVYNWFDTIRSESALLQLN